MEFTQNDQGKRDIMNKIIILNKQCKYKYIPKLQRNTRSIRQPQ